MKPAFEIIGAPKKGGILIIADHSSNNVPGDAALGLSDEILASHIAWDIGVDAVSRLIVQNSGFSAILATNSRLLVDLNRYEDEAAVVPVRSDGIDIAGNKLSSKERGKRLELYYRPYHDAITSCLLRNRPRLILSLHSFTPKLASNPDQARPWEIGVLYNDDNRAACAAIPLLTDYGFNVGDQLPYSGKLLNATMNRHAEANGIAYLGIEMRQDLVGDGAGQARFAAILSDVCHKVIETLGEV
jgi:predicted N-formylglutamate amidohydrolase